MIAFGPVPSRRLGQSLGINNIPPKVCSYDCVYCQVGPTTHEAMYRREFYPPEEIFNAVNQKVKQVKAAGGKIDYLTFVPDGEPTLDIHLGKAIELLRPLSIKIAVISNASLLWKENVRQELALADLVSLKMDAVEETAWRKVNRPNARLAMDKVLDGALRFSQQFQGELITETMLVKGVNDGKSQLRAVAAFLKKIKPAMAYIGIPTRPPSETWVQPPDEQRLTEAYEIFTAQLDKVEYLIGFPEDTFTVSGDVLKDLLDITSVHPMRESEVLEFLKKGGADEAQLKELLDRDQLVRVVHEGEPFYVRKLQFEYS